MRRIPRIASRVAFLGALLAVGAVWVVRHGQRGEEANWSPEPSPATKRGNVGAEVVATVRTVPIQKKHITEDLAVYGTVIPAPGAVQAISVPFESQVRRVFVSSGQRVVSGEKLLEITPSPDTQLQMEEARHAVQSAKQSLHYVQQRLALKLATNDQVLQAQQTLQNAQLRLDSLERRGIERQRELRTDMAGLILTVAVQEGAIVPAGSPLVELVAQDRLEVRLGVEPEDLDQLQPAQAIVLRRVNRPAAYKVTGQIRKISRAVNPATRFVDVFVTLPSSADFLLNEYIWGTITIASIEGLIVPRAAVLPEEGRYVVFTIHAGRAKKHSVQLGVENNQEVEVISHDLHPNDQVVILGNYELRDGMAVAVEPAG